MGFCRAAMSIIMGIRTKSCASIESQYEVNIDYIRGSGVSKPDQVEPQGGKTLAWEKATIL